MGSCMPKLKVATQVYTANYVHIETAMLPDRQYIYANLVLDFREWHSPLKDLPLI